jgi:hypothetical protein
MVGAVKPPLKAKAARSSTLAVVVNVYGSRLVPDPVRVKQDPSAIAKWQLQSVDEQPEHLAMVTPLCCN